jgi:hypothetical protein
MKPRHFIRDSSRAELAEIRDPQKTMEYWQKGLF